jgi:hypothetical protein
VYIICEGIGLAFGIGLSDIGRKHSQEN